MQSRAAECVDAGGAERVSASQTVRAQRGTSYLREWLQEQEFEVALGRSGSDSAADEGQRRLPCRVLRRDCARIVAHTSSGLVARPYS